MFDDVTKALSDPDAKGVVTAFLSLPMDVVRQLEDESARWGINRTQMLVIGFRTWTMFQQLQAHGRQLLVAGPGGELEPITLAAGTDSPLGGYWPFGQRPAAGDTSGGRG